jgi:hypothetical protein
MSTTTTITGPERTTAMSTFTVTTLDRNPDEAIARVQAKLDAKVPGFATTGRTAVRSERHGLTDVEVTDLGGDRDDLWFWLTSYGMSPAKGVSKFGDAIDGMVA